MYVCEYYQYGHCVSIFTTMDSLLVHLVVLVVVVDDEQNVSVVNCYNHCFQIL